MKTTRKAIRAGWFSCPYCWNEETEVLITRGGQIVTRSRSCPKCKARFVTTETMLEINP